MVLNPFQIFIKKKKKKKKIREVKEMSRRGAFANLFIDQSQPFLDIWSFGEWEIWDGKILIEDFQPSLGGSIGCREKEICNFLFEGILERIKGIFLDFIF